jgi:hypothetical protein
MSRGDKMKLPPTAPFADRRATVQLRLRRLRARAWMKEHGIRDLGRTPPIERRIEA